MCTSNNPVEISMDDLCGNIFTDNNINVLKQKYSIKDIRNAICSVFIW